jgi:hypothetical protein
MKMNAALAAVWLVLNVATVFDSHWMETYFRDIRAWPNSGQLGAGQRFNIKLLIRRSLYV